MTTENLKKIEALLKCSMNAQETLNQLKWGGVQKMMSWGFRNPANVQNKGLLFRVSGFLHKGYVLITLDWTDTYIVHLLSLQCEVKKTIENVYCNELTERIDVIVEK